MKLLCTFINPLYLAPMSIAFTVGEVFESIKRKGSIISAVDIASKQDSGGAIGNKWSAVPCSNPGEYKIVASGGVTLAKFKTKPDHFSKSEKPVELKFDRVGKVDKRRYRRVCRQYRKIRFTSPASYCQISDAHMARIARYHRR